MEIVNDASATDLVIREGRKLDWRDGYNDWNGLAEQLRTGEQIAIIYDQTISHPVRVINGAEELSAAYQDVMSCRANGLDAYAVSEHLVNQIYTHRS